MDKITRILLLFSKLMQGEKINKISFCMEMDCLPRTFDRDIEDIRMYLSEFFCIEELKYDKVYKNYYLTGLKKSVLEVMEYLLLKRLLIDARILRSDEIKELLSNLVRSSENPNKILAIEKINLENYNEPFHKKAIIKMHGDLATIIRDKSIINIRYMKMNEEYVNRELLPCEIKYEGRYLYLIAFLIGADNKYPAYYRLDRIDSFSIIRKQYKDEEEQVELYLNRHSKGIVQMYGGKFVRIILSCKKEYYQYVYDKFKEINIISEDEELYYIRLDVFEDGFVRWIISQPIDSIEVVEPQETKDKIIDMARKIANKYMGVCQNDEET